MASNPSLKNYYQILGVSESASLFEIENAYQKLAAKWHPDKHKKHRKAAQAKFHDISEAFEVLSDRNKRAHYDELLIKQYSLDDAHSTFDRFFNEHGLVDEQEEKFFNQHYPNPLKNYYTILGLPGGQHSMTSKMHTESLRSKITPKTIPMMKSPIKTSLKTMKLTMLFLISSKLKNMTIYFLEKLSQSELITSLRTSSETDGSTSKMMIQDQFFTTDEQKNLDKLMLHEADLKDLKKGEKINSPSYWSNKNGLETGKTVTTKKTVKDGKANKETTEEYTFLNGEKTIAKTTNINGKVETKNFALKKRKGYTKRADSMTINDLNTFKSANTLTQSIPSIIKLDLSSKIVTNKQSQMSKIRNKCLIFFG